MKDKILTVSRYFAGVRADGRARVAPMVRLRGDWMGFEEGERVRAVREVRDGKPAIVLYPIGNGTGQIGSFEEAEAWTNESGS